MLGFLRPSPTQPLAPRGSHPALGCSASPALNKLKLDFSKAPAKASKQVPAPVNEEQISDIRQTARIIAASPAPAGTLVGEAGPRPAAKDRALEMLLLPWAQLLLHPSSSQRCQDGSRCHPGAARRKTSLSQVLARRRQFQPRTGDLLPPPWEGSSHPSGAAS